MESKVEKYISDYTKNCSNELCSVEDRYGKTIISYREWITPDQALRAAEIAREETIDKACEWIKEHSYDYLEFGEAGFGADFHYPKMIEDFRKAMKGEQQ